ncbi:GOLPH3/VPS74 family protein [Microbacterium sp.]|uniref:GOLPH3/VPS74 family protein n=1 Tax=Microbacterium sp. TaxID=51671 RepID=UPI0039E555C7
MLTVEELYLLLIRENGDPEVFGSPYGQGLNAALLTDLLVAGRISVTGDSPERIQVVSTAPSGRLPLDFGIERIQDRDGAKVTGLISSGRFNPEIAVVESLVHEGLLERGRRKLLGFGLPRTPQPDPGPKQRIRARLAEVFSGEREPTAADATILAAATALDIAPQLLSKLSGTRDRAQFEQRVAAIVGAAPATEAAVARITLGLQFNRAKASRGGSAIGPAVSR